MTNQVIPVSGTQYIPALLRKVSQGFLKIPAFQRNLVWKERDVLELLESIYRGYPIGSLLFWKTRLEAFHEEKALPYPINRAEESDETSWVIDGMQRISCLYGVFNWDESWDASLEYLNVHFDLDEENFFVPSRREKRNLGRCIALSKLFSARKILDEHRKFLDFDDGDLLIENSVKLQSIFQEYLIPTVTLQNASVEEVVIVFERINNTGIKLNISQFMRAITWSRNFDLDEEIDRTLEEFNLGGFDIPHEVFTKAVAIVQGRGISPSEVAKIRNNAGSQLKFDIHTTGEYFRAMSDFLIEEFKIYNYRFLPYEGQALFLFKMIMSNPSDDVVEACKKWVWRTSFSETLRGKPDDHIQQHLHKLDRAINGNTHEIDVQFTLVPEKFLERKFLYGAALTMATSAMFAVHGAIDPIGGHVVQPSHFMEGNNAGWFHPIIPHEYMKSIGHKVTPSSRVLANLMLLAPERAQEVQVNGYVQNAVQRIIHDPVTMPNLETQFIDSEATRLLLSANYDGFLSCRAALMTNFAAELAGVTYRWT